jgi:hypothetical protein
VLGGHVIAQCAVAGAKTVGEGYLMHVSPELDVCVCDSLLNVYRALMDISYFLEETTFRSYMKWKQ